MPHRPFAEQPRADGARLVHPGYARPGWQTGGPGVVFDGLFETTVAEIAAVYEDAIPKLLAG